MQTPPRVARRLRKSTTLLLSAAGLLISSVAAIAQDSSATGEPKLSRLLRTSPESANAMSYMNIPALTRLLDEANLPSNLSDRLEEVWLISDLDLLSMSPKWEAGFAVVKREVDAQTLAESLDGYIDQVAGKEVVWTPQQSYLLPVGDQRLGFLRPSDRRLLSDWLTSKGANAGSAYLQAEAAQPEKFLSLMIAVDLENAFSPVALQQRTAALESLANADAEAASRVLSQVRGMSIIVGRRSLNECIVRFDFNTSPEILAPIAPAVLDEILKRNGTAAPEVASWMAKTQGNRLEMRGSIGENTLDGLLGIFSLRSQAARTVQTIQANTEEPSSGPAAASKEYFGKVTALIERVRKYEAQSTGWRAKWNDQQARRIDELPTLYVDERLVDYGSNVANLLRGNALTIRSGNIQAGSVKEAQTLQQGGYYGYSSYDYGGWGYYDPNSSADYQRVTDAQARASAYGDYRQTLSAIDKMTGEVRRAMTQKYNIQF